MNVTTSEDFLLLREQDCSEAHDAEIVYVGKKADIDALGPDFAPDDINDLSDSGLSYAVCTSLLSDEDLAKIGEDVTYGIASEDRGQPRPATLSSATSSPRTAPRSRSRTSVRSRTAQT